MSWLLDIEKEVVGNNKPSASFILDIEKEQEEKKQKDGWVWNAFKGGVADVAKRAGDVFRMNTEEIKHVRDNTPIEDVYSNPNLTTVEKAALLRGKQNSPAMLDGTLAYREGAAKKADSIQTAVDPGGYDAPQGGLKGIAHDLVRNAPYTLASMAANLPIAVATGGVSLLPTLIASGTEAQMEQADAYRVLREQGMSHEEAYAKSQSVLAKNMALLGASNALQTGAALKAGRALKSAPLKAAAGVGADAAFNAGEEVGQTLISDSATGNKTELRDLLRAGTVGALSGGAFGAVGAVSEAYGGKAARGEQKPSPSVAEQVQEAVAVPPTLPPDSTRIPSEPVPVPETPPPGPQTRKSTSAMWAQTKADPAFAQPESGPWQVQRGEHTYSTASGITPVKAKSDEYITVDGSDVFGVVDETMAKAVDPRYKGGPIRMTVGTSYKGFAHSRSRHLEEMQAIGFDDVFDFVSYVSNNYTEVLGNKSGKKNSLSLFTPPNPSGRVPAMIVDLNRTKDGYTVTSAFPASEEWASEYPTREKNDISRLPVASGNPSMQESHRINPLVVPRVSHGRGEPNAVVAGDATGPDSTSVLVGQNAVEPNSFYKLGGSLGQTIQNSGADVNDIDSYGVGYDDTTEQDWGSKKKLPSIGHVVKALEKSPTVQQNPEKYFVDYAAVSDVDAARIKQETGVDVSGYTHVVQANAIQHVLKRHGKDGTALKDFPGQVPLGENDFNLIPQIVANPDEILVGRKNAAGQDTLVFKKRIGDDYVFIEEVRTGRKKLAMVTMWKDSAQNKPQPLSRTHEASRTHSTVDSVIAADTQNILPDTLNVNDTEQLSGLSGSFFEPQMPGGSGDTSPKVRDIRGIIAKVLDMPVREGQVRGKGVLGFINHTQGVIRSKYKGDVATMLHEFGHAIDRIFKLSQSSAAATEEIKGMARVMGYSKDKHSSEGLAQFFQWRGVDPTQAYAQYPEYSKVFDAFLTENPDAAEMVDAVFSATRQYYGASPEARLDAVITDGRPRKPPLKERAMQSAKNAYKAIVDSNSPFHDVNKGLAAQLGVDVRHLPDNINVEAAARTFPGHKRLITEDVAKVQEVLSRHTEEDYAQMRRYMTAAGALDYFDNGMNPGTGHNREQLEGIIDRTPAAIKQASEEIRQIFTSVVENTLVKSGIVTEKTLRAWQEKYPNYVPMLRDNGDGDYNVMTPQEAKMQGFVDLPDPIHARRGAKNEREIVTRIDPVVSMIRNIERFHELAARNDVGKTLTKAAKLPGMAWAAEKVPGPGKDTFQVWEGGKKRYYATEPQIYAAIKCIGELGIPQNSVLQFMRGVNNTFKMGTTRYNPAFLLKNLLRDAFTVAVQSRSKITDLKALPVVNTIDGILQMVGGDKQLLQEAIEDGVFYSSIVEISRDVTPDFIQRQLKGGAFAEKMKQARAAIEKMGAANETVEMAPKFREYVELRGQGLPRKQAAMEARQVNTDFQRAGTFGRYANQYVAFLNAQIQGLDKMARTFKDHPVQTLVKAGMYIVLPSLMEWALYHDDEDYKELDKGIKDTHWVFKIPGTREFVRVPMPFEIGVIFGGGTKRVMEKMFSRDPAAWYKFGASLKDAVVPNMMPQVLSPVIENWANKDSFRDRPIVPMKEQRLPAGLQYGDSTSFAARKIGGALDVSPRKIDHTIKGYTGTVGLDAVRFLDPEIFKDKNGPQKRWTEAPVVRSFTADPRKLSHSIDRFYEIADKLERGAAGTKKEGERNPDAGLAQGFAARKRAIGKIWKEIAAVREHPKMPPQKKREIMDRLNERAVGIARSALERYDRE